MSVALVLFTPYWRRRQGRTGVPIVDAGMRQLDAEGWMPNRARLIVAAFRRRRSGSTGGTACGRSQRRSVPELSELQGAAAHEPWRAPLARVAAEYPEPLGIVT